MLPLPRFRAAPPAAGPVEVRPLSDAYGRVATDLRVSLTDRCNLRCQYCMPAEGLDWLPRDEVLTNDEILRLIRVGGRSGHPAGAAEEVQLAADDSRPACAPGRRQQRTRSEDASDGVVLPHASG